jgi:RHS repeat-associated protein
VIEAINGSTTTDIYFDTAGRDIEERVGGTVTRQYVWGLGGPDLLVLRDDNGGSGHNYGTATSGLSRRIFVQQDANTNVTGLVDTSGNVLERFAYDPYGTKYVEDANWSPVSDGYSWLYTWQAGRQDPTSGLIHFGAPGRDYSTSLGRWTEPDPAGYIDGANLYQADGSAPSDRIDPSGMDGMSMGGEGFAPGPGSSDGFYRGGVSGIRPVTNGNVYQHTAPGTMEPMDMAADGGLGSDECGTDGPGGKQRVKPGGGEDQFQEVDGAQRASKNKRPSIKPTNNDDCDDWEGAKKRPKQNRIKSIRKSQDRGSQDIQDFYSIESDPYAGWSETEILLAPPPGQLGDIGWGNYPPGSTVNIPAAPGDALDDFLDLINSVPGAVKDFFTPSGPGEYSSPEAWHAYTRSHLLRGGSGNGAPVCVTENEDTPVGELVTE